MLMSIAFALDATCDWLVWGGGIVAAVALVLGVNYYFAWKRTQALMAVAPEIGFQFEGKAWTDNTQAPKLVTALFGRGHSRKFRNVMTGSAAGMRASLFDYSYATGGGKYQHTHRQTVAAYQKSGLNLPAFEMQPAGMLAKIWNAMLHKNINFESHPDFSSRYQLRSPMADEVRTLFTPGLLSFLESLDTSRKWRLEGINDTLIVYRDGKKAKPGDFRIFLEETSTIASSFFSHCSAKKF